MGTVKEAFQGGTGKKKAVSLSYRQLKDDSIKMMGFSQLETSSFININT